MDPNNFMDPDNVGTNMVSDPDMVHTLKTNQMVLDSDHLLGKLKLLYEILYTVYLFCFFNFQPVYIIFLWVPYHSKEKAGSGS